jgi:hypothetical protein
VTSKPSFFRSKLFYAFVVLFLLSIPFIDFRGVHHLFNDSQLRVNAEGFYEFPLPAHMGLGDYGRNDLFTYFQINEPKTVVVEKVPTLAFYQKLTSTTRDKFNYHLKLEQGQQSQELLQLLSSYSNSVISIDKTVSGIHDQSGKPLDENLTTIARGRLIVLMLYDLKQGLFMRSALTRNAMYFVKINRYNLRQLTLDDQDQFEDKTYAQICHALKQVQHPDFYQRMAKMLVEGYTPAVMARLDEDEKQLLLDIGGIYMAEAWRLKARNPKREVLQILPEACLLNLYFESGGKFIPSFDADSEFQSFKPCQPFSMLYRDFILYTQPHDEAISSYVARHHPLLYYQMKWHWPGEPRRLLKNLSRYLNDPTYYSYYSQWLVNQLIEILQEKAKEI